MERVSTFISTKSWLHAMLSCEFQRSLTLVFHLVWFSGTCFYVYNLPIRHLMWWKRTYFYVGLLVIFFLVGIVGKLEICHLLSISVFGCFEVYSSKGTDSLHVLHWVSFAQGISAIVSSWIVRKVHDNFIFDRLYFCGLFCFSVSYVLSPLWSR